MALSRPDSGVKKVYSQLSESEDIVPSDTSSVLSDYPIPSEYTGSPSLVQTPSAEPAIREPEKDKMKSPPPSAIADPTNLDGSSTSASSAPASASASSSKGKQAVIIAKDEEYFMEGTFMVFQVERCLFRVPSYLFSKESHVFGGMFRLPQPYPHHSESGEAEGSSEANPIILPNEFTKADFRCLLKALYPLSFTLRLALPKEEWLSVLNLSTKWYFLKLRETAISELEALDNTPDALTSLENIIYGRKYRISSWLLSGLVDLVMRDRTIDDDVALDIDADYPTTAYKLFRTRELRFRGFLTSRTLGIKEIEVLFNDELAQVRFDEKAYEAPEVEIALENPEPVSPVPEDGESRNKPCSPMPEIPEAQISINPPYSLFEDPAEAPMTMSTSGQLRAPSLDFTHGFGEPSNQSWGYWNGSLPVSQPQPVFVDAVPVQPSGKKQRKPGKKF